MESVKEIKIDGCWGCPFNYEFDMAEGYGCKLHRNINAGTLAGNELKINQDRKKWQPITPEWCPLKTGDFIFKFIIKCKDK